MGSFPTDVVSLVTPFELQAVSPAKGGVPAHADLRHVGVSSDGTNIYFGLSSYGDWTWPSDVEFDVYIDTNEDGTYDRVAFNSFLISNAQGVRGTDVFVTGVLNNLTGAQTGLTFLNGFGGNQLDTAIYNNNTMVMAVPISSLGFATGDTSFRYRIDVFDWNLSGRTDAVGRGTFGGADSPLTFNYAAPGLSFPTSASAPNNSGVLFPDMDTRTIPVNFNRTNLTTNRSLGALLLHHFNVRGTRAEVATVQGTATAATDLSVGMAVDRTNPALNSNVTFTVVVSNNGPANATNVRVLDKLPAGLEFVSAAPSVGTYDPATGIWTVGSLASGASATLQLVAAARTTDPVTNTARVAGADQLDTNGANDQVSVQVSAPRSADLAITLTAGAPTSTAGSTAIFTATVTNLGEDPAHNIVVTTGLTPAANVTSAAPSSGVFNAATGVWNIASLGKGLSAMLTFSVTVPVVCGDLAATASVTSETADPNTLNNTASATVSVQPSATLQFSQDTYEVTEATTAVNVVVTREGDASIPLSVEYSTADGTARGRNDYTDAVGRLSFAAGETSKTITVLINDDSRVEGTETFTITLSNTGSCDVGLGTIATTTVQINDNVPESTSNVIDDPATFVRQHYHDFLGRAPEAAGLAAWVAVLQNCPNQFNTSPTDPSAGCDRITVSSAFFRSPEFQLKGYYAIRFYLAVLGRDPTYREFIRDLSRLNGATAAETEAARAAFPAEFLQRAEVRAIYDPLTNAQFVDRVLQTAGIMLPNRDQLIADLDSGAKTRAQVLREIIESTEVTDRFFNRGFVLSQYFGYLRRDPDQQGLQAWLNYLNANPGDFRTMVLGFVNSIEYRMRFGQP